MKDANDALRDPDFDFDDAFARAERLMHPDVLHVTALRESVWRYFSDPHGQQGRPVRSLPTLTSLLAGHRPGELTVSYATARSCCSLQLARLWSP